MVIKAYVTDPKGHCISLKSSEWEQSNMGVTEDTKSKEYVQRLWDKNGLGLCMKENLSCILNIVRRYHCIISEGNVI